MFKNFIGAIAGAACLAFGAPVAAETDYPNRPLEIIVPSSPGGSIDTFARILQSAIDSTGLYPSVVVLNKPGAGGTIGTRDVKDSAPDGYKFAVSTTGIVTSKVMGVVDYDHSDMTLLGAVGRTDLFLAVKDDSRFATIQDLIAEAKSAPKSVTVATNIGLPVFSPR